MELILISSVILTGLLLGFGATFTTVYAFEREQGNPNPRRAAWRFFGRRS